MTKHADVQKNFTPIEVNGVTYKLDHLDSDFSFITRIINSGQPKDITIKVHPTNHLYTRAVEERDNEAELRETNEWQDSYRHEEGVYRNLLPLTGKHSDKLKPRVFCKKKYYENIDFITFTKYLENNPKTKASLPSADSSGNGNVKTCVSIPVMDGMHYVVMYSLYKPKGIKSTINMLVETAYKTTDNSPVVKKHIKQSKAQQQKHSKPFDNIVKNTFEGRNSHETGSQKSKNGKFSSKAKAKRKGKEKYAEKMAKKRL